MCGGKERKRKGSPTTVVYDDDEYPWFMAPGVSVREAEAEIKRWILASRQHSGTTGTGPYRSTD